MKENIKKTMIKTTAIVLTAAMAITLSPVCSGAKGKKPAFDSESYYLREGESVTAKVKKNGNAIKSTTWKSGNKKIFTIKKKSNTRILAKLFYLLQDPFFKCNIISFSGC